MTWTIQSLLDWATEYFTKHGIELPHLEAEILLANALKLKRIDLYVQHERELKNEELAAFKPLILRRIKKEPIAYIIGHKPFMSLDFKVNPDVLIPRPETEKLVEVVIDIAKKEARPLKILDLCCGSGAIAISIAKYLDNALISAADISTKAVETALLNAKNLGVEEKVKFYTGNLFEALPKDERYDIIVSNPPYIPSAEIEKLQPEVRLFEPKGALDGGPDGLNFYRAIISGLPGRLEDGGSLVLEIGQGQAGEASELIAGSGIFEAPKVFEDYNGINRVVTAKRNDSLLK